jgi:hypothetical protein
MTSGPRRTMCNGHAWVWQLRSGRRTAGALVQQQPDDKCVPRGLIYFKQFQIPLKLDLIQKGPSQAQEF